MCAKTDISSLSVEEQSKCAFDRIVRIANKREISSKKMRMKLETVGFSEEAINDSIGKAVEYGFIDDRRYSECLIRTTLSMGKGLSQIEYEIKALGIDLFELEPYQQYIKDGEQMQLERAIAVLNKHSTRSKNPYASCFRKLISRGFSLSVAEQATKEYLSVTE